MKQLIIDTIIKWCEGATDNVADGVRFNECANELSQLLNKHDCYTTLEELEQMLSKELKLRDDKELDFEIRKQAAKDAWDFKSVIRLIKERQANVV